MAPVASTKQKIESPPGEGGGEKLIVNKKSARAQQDEADEWFNSEWRKAWQGPKVPTLPPDRFGFSKPAHFVQILRKKADGTTETIQIPLTPAIYDRAKIKQVLQAEGANDTVPPPAELTTLLFTHAALTRVVVQAPEREVWIGAFQPLHGAPVPDGVLPIGSQPCPLNGTVFTFSSAGSPELSSIESAEEYRAYLPVLHSAGAPANGWCFDLPCERVAPMADQVPQMLINLREQIKNLHGVRIYMIQPRWLRYFSDGDMTTQRPGEHGLRNTTTPGFSGLRPLLYDGPAWVVGLVFGSRMLSGRVFVTPDGWFICSDWCQREVGKQGGIDLITGLHTKHTLMTWCAGPGISRFGDETLKAAHGTVRRAKLGAAKKKPVGTLVGTRSHPSYPPLALLLRRLIDTGKGRSDKPVKYTGKIPDDWGPNSVRVFYYGSQKVGLLLRTRMVKSPMYFSHMPLSIAITFIRNSSIGGPGALKTHILNPSFEGDPIPVTQMWQAGDNKLYAVVDPDVREKLYTLALDVMGCTELLEGVQAGWLKSGGESEIVDSDYDPPNEELGDEPYEGEEEEKEEDPT